MRTRIHFSKTEEMRFTGHLDLHKTWERSMRRAGLPLAYSQGFKPHPKINLACALPLGFTSQAEIVDIYLEPAVSLDTVLEKLAPALPPGIQVTHIEEVPGSLPALQTVVDASDYHITFLDPLDGLDAQVNAILSAASLPRQRQGKPYDLRPLVESLELLPPNDEGCQQLRVRLAARNGATGRPEELVLAMGGEPTATRVHRTSLIFAG